ncbi:LamG-like jellyroll fold domain-containing protein [Spongiactinospora sp. TRM90649]|uniref:LamG-like jellyroll fold domain-containing protein n=1 Tax=Spongiactinospora sp. TRM90649 TaxID=3031114 RepID=UPI0023F77DB2|nr:LamG-like jellyroll fold domain-containing protein [Spongiactinospora sp. TRM90649]MDF5758238.1 PQQ-dependent sugar dehydrogenase [Spongiactinospora sp. TRM90649]
MTRVRRAVLSIVLLMTGLVGLTAAPAAALPAHFEKQVAFSGLVQPTNVEFAADGRVFVAEKSGLIKVFDSLSDTTATVYADLRTQVHNFWDRGLLGMALHPDFPDDPRIYVLYTRDAVPGGNAPRWGTAGVSADPCPTPPGPTGDGCLVTGRLSVISPTGAETPLITDWCQQYPSHSVGDLQFGRDGALYASAGDGASFNFADYGQDNLTGSDVTPDNPCGDPPSPTGTALTPPTAEGGALRAQDVRTADDPAGLDGALIRIDPDTGTAATGNPNAGSADANVARIVANGMRNPFRITNRPGTDEIWYGEVGWSTYEEIGRVVNPTGSVQNFGWPCYEGPNRQGGYDNLNLTLCENLYAQGAGAHAAPYFAWNHNARVVPGEPCPSGGSSASGVAFYEGGDYPDTYDGALFFSDYSRGCVWVMPRGANGLPATGSVATFDSATPVVELETGPEGDLFAVDLNGGRILRYIYNNTPPVAVISASATSGAAPLTVNFSGTGSTDADGDPLTYAWDLDGDGDLDDSTSATPSRTYTQPGSYPVRLRVSDGRGGQGDATVTVNVNNTAPTAQITTPTTSTDWAVGETVGFSGSGTDAEDGTIPGSRMSWTLIMHHCPSTCHEHQITTFTGQSGSFQAPDHEYPAHLELRLTVTDTQGLTDTESVLLQPRTVNLTFQTVPSGLRLGFNGEQTTAPFTRTVIVGSSNSVAAPSPQGDQGFVSWSDGGAAGHNVTAPATAATYTATFQTVQQPTGLVAAYGMDEATGAAVTDASGNGHNGTARDATRVATGRHGGALSFNGSSSWVRVADAAGLRLTSGMTVEAWVRPVAVGSSYDTVVLKEHPSGLSYALFSSTDGSRPSSVVSVSGETETFGSSGLGAGVWSHLAATYDGSALRLFVNGVQVGSRPVTGDIRVSSGRDLFIGGNEFWGDHFEGLIDEVRIYDRALSAAQIQADMNTPVGPPPEPDTQAPTAPGSLTAIGGPGSAQLTWTAATDNVGVSGYNVHRSATAGFTPSGANQVGSTPGTAFTDSGVAPGTYYYRVVAFDAVPNQGPPSGEATATVTEPPVNSGLVAAYGMNEGAGTSVADGSGNGHGGTARDVTWTASGRYGQALSFNGSSSWVRVADAAGLRLTSGMTVEAWVRPVAVGSSYDTVVLKEHPSGLSYALFSSTDGSRPSSVVSVSGETETFGSSGLGAGVWSHLAATYDGSALRLFVNGVQVGSRPVTGDIRVSSGRVFIGGNEFWGDHFEGLIDEVRIYDRALSAAQIQADMNSPVS